MCVFWGGGVGGNQFVSMPNKKHTDYSSWSTLWKSSLVVSWFLFIESYFTFAYEPAGMGFACAIWEIERVWEEGNQGTVAWGGSVDCWCRERKSSGGINESVPGAFAVSLIRGDSNLSLTFWEITQPLCTSVSLWMKRRPQLPMHVLSWRLCRVRDK